MKNQRSEKIIMGQTTFLLSCACVFNPYFRVWSVSMSPWRKKLQRPTKTTSRHVRCIVSMVARWRCLEFCCDVIGWSCYILAWFGENPRDLSGDSTWWRLFFSGGKVSFFGLLILRLKLGKMDWIHAHKKERNVACPMINFSVNWFFI